VPRNTSGRRDGSAGPGDPSDRPCGDSAVGGLSAGFCGFGGAPGDTGDVFCENAGLFRGGLRAVATCATRAAMNGPLSSPRDHRVWRHDCRAFARG
jgi:hypothetical protein